MGMLTVLRGSSDAPVLALVARARQLDAAVDAAAVRYGDRSPSDPVWLTTMVEVSRALGQMVGMAREAAQVPVRTRAGREAKAALIMMLVDEAPDAATALAISLAEDVTREATR